MKVEDVIALEFSTDIDEPNKFQTSDGEWHTGIIPVDCKDRFDHFLRILNSWMEENKLDITDYQRVKYLYPEAISIRELSMLIERCIDDTDHI